MLSRALSIFCNAFVHHSSGTRTIGISLFIVVVVFVVIVLLPLKLSLQCNDPKSCPYFFDCFFSLHSSILSVLHSILEHNDLILTTMNSL